MLTSKLLVIMKRQRSILEFTPINNSKRKQDESSVYEVPKGLELPHQEMQSTESSTTFSILANDNELPSTDENIHQA